MYVTNNIETSLYKMQVYSSTYNIIMHHRRECRDNNIIYMIQQQIIMPLFTTLTTITQLSEATVLLLTPWHPMKDGAIPGPAVLL